MFAGGSRSDPYYLAPTTQNPSGTRFYADTGGYDLTGRGAPVAAASALTTAVLLSIGQSYAANSATGGYTVTQAQNHNFSIHNGAIYTSKANVLGCSNVGDGIECFLPRLADSIITGGAKQRVILVPTCIGGTNWGQWSVANTAASNSGYLNHRITVAALRLAAAGVAPTHVMASMGSGDASLGVSKANCKLYIQSVRDTLTNNGISATLYLEKCTWISGGQPAGATAIRDAMDEMVNGTTIKAGPDTDVYNNTYRQDTTHWNGTGCASVAADWKTSLGL